MKVGKEEIAGLVRAVELYLATDHERQSREWSAIVEAWLREVGAIPGLRAERLEANEAGQPVPRVRVTVDEARAGVSAEELRRRLWNDDPRILVLPDGRDAFFLTPDTVTPSEAAAIVPSIRIAAQSLESLPGPLPPLD
jgi:L-seryl-tRNA(Ser) seleniumtransferase